MKIFEIVNEEFNHPRKPKSAQIYGDINTAYDVQDLLDYATHNLRVQQIPLKSLIKNTPPYSLPGDSDEPDNSPEFKQRTAGITLRDYVSGNYPPILVVKNKSGEYEVTDGRHRTVNFVNLIKQAHKNPLTFSMKGYLLDQRKLDNISTIAKKNDREIDQ